MKIFNLHSKIWTFSIYILLLLIFVFAIVSKFLNPLSLTYNFFMWLTFLLVVIMLINLLIIVLQFRSPHREYEEFGYLENWYYERLKIIGTNWTTDFIKEIYAIINKSTFSFFSPSANAGVYEKAMFNYISKSTTTNFYISDLANLEKFESNVFSSSNFIYTPKIDVIDAINQLPASVDVIFDMKGALWHSFNKSKILNKYLDCLNPDGLLIIDSTEVSAYHYIGCQFKYIFTYLFKHKTTLRVEQSTYQKMHLRNKNYLFKHFVQLKTLSIKTEDNKSIDFIIFQKK